jgi:4-amino-4-deoxy-L-arabinose transferase-like glycosyltransferase
MTNSLKLGIISVFALQLIMCASFGLAHDEAYYWLFSKNLSWGYFDHPPFVAFAIKLFSFLPHHEFSVRLGFVLLQAGSLFFLLTLIEKKFWWNAFLIFFSFPLASYTGLLALPDMPLLFMTAAYFYFLRGYLAGDKKCIWLLGAVIPLLLYAKYHGILLIFFTILAIPRLLLRRDFWLVTLISVMLFLPHIWWQYQNNFATLRYHFLERPSSDFSLKRVFDYLGTQLILSGLFCGPIIWWQLKKIKARESFLRVLVFVSWGILIFFLVSTFSKKVEANWTISLVIPLTILLSGSEIWSKKWAKGILLLSFLVVMFSRLAFLFPGLPLKRIAEFHGWQEWSNKVQEKCGETRIVANSYQIASKLSFYLNRDIRALNYKSRKNQFDFWNWDIDGEVCYITDKTEFHGEEILTPELKSLRIVKGLMGENLLQRKIDENARIR